MFEFIKEILFFLFCLWLVVKVNKKFKKRKGDDKEIRRR